MLRATHARKARRTGLCPLCRSPIAVGDRIVKVGRRGSWLHRDCFTRQYRPEERA